MLGSCVPAPRANPVLAAVRPNIGVVEPATLALAARGLLDTYNDAALRVTLGPNSDVGPARLQHSISAAVRRQSSTSVLLSQ